MGQQTLVCCSIQFSVPSKTDDLTGRLSIVNRKLQRRGHAPQQDPSGLSCPCRLPSPATRLPPVRLVHARPFSFHRSRLFKTSNRTLLHHLDITQTCRGGIPFRRHTSRGLSTIRSSARTARAIRTRRMIRVLSRRPGDHEEAGEAGALVSSSWTRGGRGTREPPGAATTTSSTAGAVRGITDILGSRLRTSLRMRGTV